MNILHVIGSLGETVGGTSRAVVDLVSSLRIENSFRYSLLVQESTTKEVAIEDIPIHRVPKLRILEVRRKVFEYLAGVHKSDPISLIHLHGVWSPFPHFGIEFARRHQIPYVVAPHGMLEPWCMNQKWLKKKVGWYCYQKKDLACAAAIHACSQNEKRALEDLGLKNVIVVPNGVKIRSTTPSSGRNKTVLFLSRIHEIKGIPVLLEAWGQLRPQGWNLEIYGSGDAAYISGLKKQIRKMSLSKAVQIFGHVSGQNKWDVYDRSSIFVLPSHSENFGLVVAEALVSGMPVITTNGTPWSELDEVGCGWCIELGRENLSHALSQAIALSAAERDAMATRGRNYIAKNFSWNSIASALVADYQQIAEGWCVVNES